MLKACHGLSCLGVCACVPPAASVLPPSASTLKAPPPRSPLPRLPAAGCQPRAAAHATPPHFLPARRKRRWRLHCPAARPACPRSASSSSSRRRRPAEAAAAPTASATAAASPTAAPPAPAAASAAGARRPLGLHAAAPRSVPLPLVRCPALPCAAQPTAGLPTPGRARRPRPLRCLGGETSVIWHTAAHTIHIAVRMAPLQGVQ